MGCPNFDKNARVSLCEAYYQGHDAVLIHEPDGRVVAANQAMLEVLGITPEQVKDLVVQRDLLAGQNGGQSGELPPVWQAALAGVPQRFEWKGRRPIDGATKDLEIYLRRLSTPQGPLLMATIHDISDQKRAAERIQYSLSLLNTIIEASSKGIMIVGTEGTVKFCNRLLVQMFAIPPEIEASMSDDRFFDHIRSYFKDPERVRVQAERNLTVATPERRQEIELNDGRVVERVSRPHRVEGQLVGIMLSFEDITERRRIEAEKDRMRQQLMHASKLASIGTLAGGLAHEINNPLTILRGNAQIIRKQLEELQLFGQGPWTRLVEGLEKNISRIAAIVSGMRTYARVDSALPEPQNLNQVIQESMNLMTNIYAKGGITIEAALESQRPNVMGSRGQLQQVIVNLVSNAKDALDGRENQGATIKVRTFDAEDRVVLEVSDNGCGIPAAKLAQIFDPFYTTKPPGKGTGLGLAIIESVVSAMGGKIEVDSTVGSGTTFRLFFPLQA